jgi:hypothetical protein
MHAVQDKIACLLEWCATNGVRIDPRLVIREHDDAGISVFSLGEYIPSPTTRELLQVMDHSYQRYSGVPFLFIYSKTQLSRFPNQLYCQ